jgi:DNA-binding sugar fermentation-stimulating protein
VKKKGVPAKRTRKRSVTSTSSSPIKKAANTKQKNEHKLEAMQPLLDLGNLVRGTVVKRPSSQIKSPYVADVSLNNDEIIQAHAPALDVGGMCVPGSEVYMSTRPPGGKTSHAIELVRSTAPMKNEDAVLVGAHPRLGELIAAEVLRRGLLKDVLVLDGGFEVGPVDDSSKDNKSNKISLKQQVTLGDSRVDFEMTIHNSNKKKAQRVVFEVKNVVCADYEKGTEPVKSGANHCVVVAQPDGDTSYQRTALFPWAKSRSQTFEDKKVCSARALKHLRNLHSLAQDENVTPVVLFVVNRSDCESIRACHEACPVFREVLEKVTRNDDVKALGVRVKWSQDGKCHFYGVVPVVR